ncbi:hypothetical protein [Streptomyces sp. NBC_00154]|uniref:hypothetical protein n=1 Tax=Streptomyces sp. NBC_00154 TaxID=2975670 RepID=UPI0022513194|nr:hypothetical protein [Streptomyces sp. NBC_00154]MCX5317426.1 hypothetical protein [Streptomyces sp. NBC_00154]
MELLKKQPTMKLPAQWFTGDAWADVIYRGEGPSRARANAVRFAPGARTAWHSHGLGQTLYIVEGIALVQSRGGEILEARPGGPSPCGCGRWLTGGHRATTPPLDTERGGYMNFVPQTFAKGHPRHWSNGSSIFPTC